MTWDRSHDAHIARECEGLEVSDRYGSDWHEIRSGRPWNPVSAYNTDPAAAIRAAEAWRRKGDGRSYTVESEVQYKDAIKPAQAIVYPFNTPAVRAEGDYCLAKALCYATGGPA